MMKILLTCALALMLAGAGCSKRVDLEKVPVGTEVQVTRQDGGVVQGKLAARDDKTVKVTVGSASRTVPRDQIADVQLVAETPAPLPAPRVYELIANRLGRRLASVPIPQRALATLRRLPLVDRIGGRTAQALQYVDHLANYDTRHLLELLDGSGVRCPPITEYLDRVIDFVQAHLARKREAEATKAAAPSEPPAPA